MGGVQWLIIFFIDTSRFKNFVISPIVNGLLDHDALLLLIKDLNACIKSNSIKSIRKTDTNSMAEYKIRLNCELWDNIFDNDHHKDVDILFNSFLNTEFFDR